MISKTAGHPVHARKRRMLGAGALAGIAYSVVWVSSLLAGAPNPSVAATALQVMGAFTGHGAATMIMFGLAEGAAPVALIIVVIMTARAARSSGARLAGVTGCWSGAAAALASWVELSLGAWLAYGLVPSRRTVTAGTVYQALMRIDGAKMFLLAAMAVAVSAVALTSPALPRWLAPLGVLLAASLVLSGLGYALLAPGLATVVYGSGPLLLMFVTATGLAIRDPAQRDPAQRPAA